MPEIEEGHGSVGRRPNGHRDFYHNSVLNSDGTLDVTVIDRVGLFSPRLPHSSLWAS
jgi:ribosomal protein S16